MLKSQSFPLCSFAVTVVHYRVRTPRMTLPSEPIVLMQNHKGLFGSSITIYTTNLMKSVTSLMTVLGLASTTHGLHKMTLNPHPSNTELKFQVDSTCDILRHREMHEPNILELDDDTEPCRLRPPQRPSNLQTQAFSHPGPSPAVQIQSMW